MSKQKLKQEKGERVTFTKAEKAGKRLNYEQIREQERYKYFKQQATKKARAELGIDVRTAQEKARSSTFQQKQALQKYYTKQARARGLKEARKEVFAQQLQRAPIRTSTQQLARQEQQAQKRQRQMGLMNSRAEQLEIEAVSFNEVPMLHDMERQRTRMTTPPDRSMTRIIQETSDSFPD